MLLLPGYVTTILELCGIIFLIYKASIALNTSKGKESSLVNTIIVLAAFSGKLLVF